MYKRTIGTKSRFQRIPASLRTCPSKHSSGVSMPLQPFLNEASDERAESNNHVVVSPKKIALKSKDQDILFDSRIASSSTLHSSLYLLHPTLFFPGEVHE